MHDRETSIALNKCDDTVSPDVIEKSTTTTFGKERASEKQKKTKKKKNYHVHFWPISLELFVVDAESSGDL